jgi:hypothetical protein
MQKRVFGASWLPQLVQKPVAGGAAAAAGLPHTVQNFEEAPTSLPHDEQTAIARLLKQSGFQGAKAQVKRIVPFA